MPVVWVIEAYRAGERNQVLALADTLAWPYEIKRLTYRKYEFLTNIFRGSDLRGIDIMGSDLLQAPWPDLVISSGMRNEAVCRWIKMQSGDRTRIVHVGNPWADPSRFDLVITTPQYRIPERANVLQNVLTLNNVDTARLQSQLDHWQSQFKQLPQPHTAVIVGGESGPFTLGKKAALRLAREVNELVGRVGGSALVTTSSRTSPAVAKLLQRELTIPNYFYHWQPDDDANPYLAVLALAERFVVSGDSISMLSEACATGKPVYIFDLGRGAFAMQDHASGNWRDNDWRLGGVMYRLLMRFVWQKLSRDIRLVHRGLVEQDRARWLSFGKTGEPGEKEMSGDMQAAVKAVEALFDESTVVDTV
jgi:mitochondrial fission protein ELM1